MKNFLDPRSDRTLSVIVPFIFLLFFSAIYSGEPAHYKFALREDGGFEYFQAILLLAGGVAALIHFVRSRRIVFLGWSMVCFFVLIEEISWGQRIFEIETPEYIHDLNRQGEITLHNLSTVQDWLHFAWVAAGATLIIGAWVWPQNFPPKYYALFFLPVVLFYSYYELQNVLPIPEII